MSKNKKQNVQTPKNDLVDEKIVDEQNTDVEERQVQKTTQNEKEKDSNKKNKNQKTKKNKKETSSITQKTKETFSEFKKVKWPTFGEVCKKTGVVLVVVLIFAVIIFGMDYGLGALMRLLTNRA